MTGLWRPTSAPMRGCCALGNDPFAPQGAAVTVEGSHPHQGGDLPAFQSAHSGRYARTGTVRNRYPSLATESGSSQGYGLDAWAHGRMAVRRVLLGDQHGRHLVSAGGQGVECLGLGVSQRAHGGTNGLSEVRTAGREHRSWPAFQWPWQSPVPEGVGHCQGGDQWQLQAARGLQALGLGPHSLSGRLVPGPLPRRRRSSISGP